MLKIVCSQLPGRRQSPRPQVASFRRASKTAYGVCLALTALAWGMLGPCLPALAEDQVPATAEKAAAPETALPRGPMDFEACIQLALKQSPYLLKSSLEIDIKHLDELDKKWGVIPSVKFRTRYYVDRPEGPHYRPRPYNVSFISENYNPLQSVFAIKAQKLFTQLAVLAHLEIIGAGLQRLGKMFLDLEALKRVEVFQNELVNLARQNLHFVESRLGLGTATPLEVRVAAQELEVAKTEQIRMASGQKKLVEAMKLLLGLKPTEELELDLRKVQDQVLGKFNPDAATWEEARTRSNQIKIHEIKQELQKFNIKLAKSRLLPSFFCGVTSPDPLSLSRGQDLYFFFGVDMPVWDGFERIRNIGRQKLVLKQFASDSEVKEADLNTKWMADLEDIRTAAATRKLTQSQEELARLRERQSEIRHFSGGEPYSLLVEGRKGRLEAQKLGVMKSLDYDVSVLNLRHLSGDLGASYVQASSFQK